MARATRLIVGDGDAVPLRLAAEGLRDLGLVVVTARGGADASRLPQAGPGIGVPVTDIAPDLATDLATADGTDGLALAQAAPRPRPGRHVIHAAHTTQRVPDEGEVAGAPALRKPYRPVQISGKPEGGGREGRGAMAEAA